jgi:hypothetical protein
MVRTRVWRQPFAVVCPAQGRLYSLLRSGSAHRVQSVPNLYVISHHRLVLLVRPGLHHVDATSRHSGAVGDPACAESETLVNQCSIGGGRSPASATASTSSESHERQDLVNVMRIFMLAYLRVYLLCG